MIAAQRESTAGVVREFRLSHVWHQVLVDPCSYALDRSAYESHFSAAPRRELEPPWPVTRRRGFWSYYLDGTLLDKVPPAVAWRSLVPLRCAVPMSVTTAGPSSRVECEGLFHPFGVTLIVSLRCAEETGLADLPGLLAKVRNDPDLTVEGQSRALTHVAEEGLAWLRERFGCTVYTRAAPEPFSVFSVIQAKGTEAAFDPADEAVARLLYAATSFSPFWSSVVPPAASEHRVGGLSHEPPGHLVYGTRRARVIWSPAAFLDSSGKRCTVTCHHNNLTFASAQVEALARYAAAAVERLEEGGRWSVGARDVGKRCAGILGRMYGGVRSTYRSGSVPVQLSQNDWVDPVNALRREFDQPSLR